MQPNCNLRMQSGISLAELMIALVLGMLVVLVVSGMVITCKSTQTTQMAADNIQDTARYALNNIARSVRQAGYVNYDTAAGPIFNTEIMPASITGFDAKSLTATSNGIEIPISNAKHSSDILAIRFFGSGSGDGDNTIVSCAGSGVPAPTNSTGDERGWSIYYVANDSSGETNLYCKYKDKPDKNFAAQTIARGVESFQVLYGIDTSVPSNGIANQFVNATEIDALDTGISVSELNKKTHWKKVVAIKVALLVHGTESTSIDAATTYHLFGEEYSQARGTADKGTQMTASDFPDAHKNRLRKTYSTTILIRNSVS